MTTCPTLETKRLIFRPFSNDDLQEYFQMMNTSELRDSLRIPDDEGMVEAFFAMAAWLGQWELRGTGHWALEDKATGQFLVYSCCSTVRI